MIMQYQMKRGSKNMHAVYSWLQNLAKIKKKLIQLFQDDD